MHMHFPGPAGRLEGQLEGPEGDPPPAPRAAAVVCHPHPLHGGSLRNTLVYRIARALRSTGVITLRLNFRGVGGSEGAHDGEGGEEGDVAAALDELERRYPALPLWAAGYSFGARTVCDLAAREARIRRVVAVAFPLDVYDARGLAELSPPALLVFGARDEFGTAERLRRLVGEPPPHVRIAEIAGADHLFRGRTPLVEEKVRAFARESCEDSA